MADPKQILAAAKRILLVDWPNESVPRTLIAAGFKVFGFSPKGYTEASVVSHQPEKGDGISILPPANRDGGYLVFRRLDEGPGNIDIVNVFRPTEEIPGIIETIAIPVGARILWMQPPFASTEAVDLISAKGLELIEGIDIADVARQLKKSEL